MLNQKSPRLIIFVIVTSLLLLSPIVVLFFPIAMVETLYFHRENIVLLTPKINFQLIFIAILMTIFGLVILAFKRSVIPYILTILLLIGSLVTVYFSTLSYTAIQKTQIIIKEYHTSTIYEWEDIQKVIYEYEIGTVGTYYFTTDNNKEFFIKENGQFSLDEKRAIYKSASENGAIFLEREKTN